MKKIVANFLKNGYTMTSKKNEFLQYFHWLKYIVDAEPIIHANNNPFWDYSNKENQLRLQHLITSMRRNTIMDSSVFSICNKMANGDAFGIVYIPCGECEELTDFREIARLADEYQGYCNDWHDKQITDDHNLHFRGICTLTVKHRPDKDGARRYEVIKSNCAEPKHWIDIKERELCLLMAGYRMQKRIKDSVAA